MKKEFFLKRSNYLWLTVLIAIFATGCTSSENYQERVEVTAIMVTATPSVTAWLVSLPTATVVATPNTIEVTSSSIAISSPAKAQVPTLTPIPTLSTKQRETLEAREQLVRDFMQTNSNCQLPCWWGIELGTSLEDIRNGFATVDIGIWRTTISDFGDGGNRGYIKSGYFDSMNQSYNVGISMDFYTVDEKVEFIDVLTERPFRQYAEKEFVRDWEKYFLSSMLQQYGKPDYVYLIPITIADPSPPNHILSLYYPELGINVSYSFYGEWVADREAKICLELENARNINLSLYNPTLADVWGTYLVPPNHYPDSEQVELFSQWTWEAQTDTDLEAFYKAYKNPNNLGCILVMY